MAFPLLPALHLDRGEIREAPKEEAAPLLSAVARKHTEVVVVDAQGLRANSPDLETIQRASRNRAIWSDAGSRTIADVSDLFVAGATRVTARWNTLLDRAELEEAAELTEALYLGVEVGASFVANPRERMPQSALAALMERLALPVVIIDLGGRDVPSSEALVVADAFRGAPERWYMGQVRREDALRLEDRGFAGAILPLASLQEGE